MKRKTGVNYGWKDYIASRLPSHVSHSGHHRAFTDGFLNGVPAAGRKFFFG